ncbi:MAG: NUDIX domain-containing protein [Dehalococcoidia bacterium]|nr:MAG: NUDIX domain-containing protein [Dehalococcoidia bacterium]
MAVGRELSTVHCPLSTVHCPLPTTHYPLPTTHYNSAVPKSPPPGVTPIVRASARVLLIDARGRILLFCVDDERLAEKQLWITPGGGIQPGETPLAAAQRELWEETGVEAEPGDCVWVRSVTLPFGQQWMESRETFYVVRIDAADVIEDNWEPQERAIIVEHRWWSVPEIAASTEWFAPRHLATLLPPVLRGEYAAEPLRIGA